MLQGLLDTRSQLTLSNKLLIYKANPETNLDQQTGAGSLNNKDKRVRNTPGGHQA